jgi:hypothetical protein
MKVAQLPVGAHESVGRMLYNNDSILDQITMDRVSLQGASGKRCCDYLIGLAGKYGIDPRNNRAANCPVTLITLFNGLMNNPSDMANREFVEHYNLNNERTLWVVAYAVKNGANTFTFGVLLCQTSNTVTKEAILACIMKQNLIGRSGGNYYYLQF